MTRPLRYRPELGIGQYKQRSDPSDLDIIVNVIFVVGAVIVIYLWLCLEAA